MEKLKRRVKKANQIIHFDYTKTSEDIEMLFNKITDIEKRYLSLSDGINNLNEALKKINANFNYVNLEMLQLNNFFDTGKKKLLICGFYGAVNLGDELMLETILKRLEDNFDITIMLCDNQNIDITRYGKYNFIHYPLNSTDFNILANYYDCLLFGGGALIDDYHYNNGFTLGRILVDLTMRFITFGKKTFLYGLSTNKSLENEEFLKKLSFVVENATYFSLRDKYSFEVLKNCGINTTKIKLVDDVVMANNFNIELDKKKNRNILDIAVIYICTDENKKQLEIYTKKLINYLKKKNKKYNISFIQFYNYHDNDKRIYQELIEKSNDDNIKIVPFTNNLEELTDVFKQNDYVISMRYHATLIANLMNKKVLNIIYSKHRHYDNKMKYMYEKYKFENNSIIYGDAITEKNFELLFTNGRKNSYDDFSIQADKDLVDAIKLMKE